MQKFKSIPWTCSDILNALKLDSNTSNSFDILSLSHCFCFNSCGEYDSEFIFSGISTDSRSIKKDEVFVALKGKNFDGHVFIQELVSKGIKGFIAEKKTIDHLIIDNMLDDFVSHLTEKDKNRFLSSRIIIFKGVILFKVDDSVKALGMLAKFQRIRSGVKILAITGSNGKTSTRKMAAEIFKTRFNTLSTQKNFNNEIGVPFTLLSLSFDHEWAIVEMGMNHKGELKRLAQMVMPDIAIITNTAKAHLEGLGTILNIAEAKAEIFCSVKKGGIAVLNMEDSFYSFFAEKAEKNNNIDKIISVGTSENASIRAESIKQCGGKICFSLVCKGSDFSKLEDHNNISKVDICMNTPCFFMVTNGLAAAAAALHAGISLDGIKKGLESFAPVGGRMNIMKSSRGLNIIDDTYNANPASVQAALKTLEILANGKESFAALGDMLELGCKSEELHYQIGREIAASGVSRLYLYGEMAVHVADGAMASGLSKDKIMTGDKKEIAENILGLNVNGAWVLVKGSRGMKMEEIVSDIFI